MADEQDGTAQRRPRVYVPSKGPDDWRAFLAKPDLHWRTGYSAKTLAHSWESHDNLPDEIARMFDDPCELLIAIPEHKVPLPGGRRDSQNDVFALIRHGVQVCATTIEGKVDEALGETVGEWLRDASGESPLECATFAKYWALKAFPNRTSGISCCTERRRP